MDESQDYLRWLSRHRPAPASNSIPRPTVRVECWQCGHEMMTPRPNRQIPCICGGVYTETPSRKEDFYEE